MWMLTYVAVLIFSKGAFVSCSSTSRVECRGQQFNFTENNSDTAKIFCHQFRSWSELNIYLKTNKWDFESKKGDKIVPYYSLMPSTPLLLTNQLDMPHSETSKLFFYNLKGLNLFPWPNSKYKSELRFHLSTIDFYINNVSSSEYTCHRNMFPVPGPNNEKSFFAHFEAISVVYGLEYTTKPVCPHLFEDSSMSNLKLQSPVDSFLYTSLFRFQDYNISDASSINSYIEELCIYGYNYKIDTGLMNPLVFEQIQEVMFF
jgi:hypothetical protein